MNEFPGKGDLYRNSFLGVLSFYFGILFTLAVPLVGPLVFGRDMNIAWLTLGGAVFTFLVMDWDKTGIPPWRYWNWRGFGKTMCRLIALTWFFMVILDIHNALLSFAVVVFVSWGTWAFVNDFRDLRRARL